MESDKERAAGKRREKEEEEDVELQRGEEDCCK